ncbi:E3 SUMO-protein ligase ZBED1-like [Watersipora subatra]|uniref:E3 SUMO-protein ligase ZBED1-like n=1 Tax=Watersipora subatra TaxID=2589382 RepID=UPI00355C2D77
MVNSKEFVWSVPTPTRVSHCPENHTAANIQLMLDQVFLDWELDAEKQVAVTTDNASNIPNAVRNQGWLRVQCFGHRLNLAVTSALRKYDELASLAAIKKIVGHFAHSHKKKRLLKDAQDRLNMKNHCLLNECRTRWGSTFLAIQRMLVQERAVRVVRSADYSAAYLLLSNVQLDTLTAIRDALMPISQLKDMLSEMTGEPKDSPYTQNVTKGQATLADMLGELMKEDMSDIAPTQQSSNTEEISLHASLPRISLKSDPLIWWREHKVTFPYLAKLAQKYLTIQATSVA